MNRKSIFPLIGLMALSAATPSWAAQTRRGRTDGNTPAQRAMTRPSNRNQQTRQNQQNVTRQPISAISVRTPRAVNIQVPRNTKGQIVHLLNEDGSPLGRSSFIWFSDQRVAIPVSAYERLGFRVQRNLRARQVTLSVPNARTGFTYTVGLRDVMEPNTATAESGIVRYEKPILQMHRGQFYLAAMGLKEYFPTLIETRWDPQTRTVSIQRTHEMNRLLRFIPKD